MHLTGTGTNDPRWLEKIVKHPPTSLQTLEYWFGDLAVDATGRGKLGLVIRPGNPPRGALRREVRQLVADFGFASMVTAFSCDLDVGHATLARLLEHNHGPGSPIATQRGPVVEYGKWFGLQLLEDGAAHLAWATERPDWALPPAAPDAREYLIATLVDRLVCDTRIEPLSAALEPLTAPAGAELRPWDGGVMVRFRPGLPIAAATSALRWDEPVASSSDVHLSSWRVHPLRLTAGDEPRVGVWCVGVHLEGWPRGPDLATLPQVGRAGASPLYDVRGAATLVSALTIEHPRSR